MGKTNPKDQGARQVFGEVDVGAVTGTVKTTEEFSAGSASTSSEDLLQSILLQLRIMNLHLSKLSCGALTEDDLEENE